MTSSTAASHHGSSYAFWIVALMSVMMVTMIAGATLAMSPRLWATPAPSTAVPVSWAAVSISKPTYTPSPVPTSTPTPLPSPTVQVVPTEIAALPDNSVPQDATAASL